MSGSQLLNFANRNLRYTILLVFVLCVTLFLLSPHARDIGKTVLIDGESKYRPGGMSLEQWVAREEAYYLESLEGRQELIAKYGPTIENIKS